MEEGSFSCMTVTPSVICPFFSFLNKNQYMISIHSVSNAGLNSDRTH